MELLIPKSNTLKIIYFSTLLFLFLSLTLIFRGGSQFYEGGAYVAYAKSMLRDLDFNIINQLSGRTSWLITKNYYHPDHHSEIQSPFLLFLYLIEYLIKLLNFRLPEDFYLASFAANFICMYLCTLLTKEYAKEIKVPFSFLAASTLILGSACFYFTFFTSTVIEIFAITLIAYVLLTHEKAKKKLDATNNYVYALALAILHCTKGFYVLLVAFFFIAHLLRLVKSKNLQSCLVFVLSFTFVLACNLLNQYIKYGDLQTPHVTLFFFFDYSLTHIVSKLFSGYFAFGKVFYINPIFFISILGTFFCFADLRKKRIITTPEFLIYLFWIMAMFFHTILVLGNLTEDHLAGRAALNTFVFMLIGLCYLCSKVHSSSKKWTIGTLLTCWTMFHVLSFVLIDFNGDFYIYPNIVVPTGEFLQSCLQKYGARLASNWFLYKTHVLSFFAFSILCGLIYSCVLKFRMNTIANASIIIFSVGFFLMTICNWQFGGINTASMKDDGLFQNRVVGNGVEIYHFDYFFDYYQSLKITANDSDKKKLENAKAEYFKVIRNQVIHSTPDFNKVLEIEADDFSFWLDPEN